MRLLLDAIQESIQNFAENLAEDLEKLGNWFRSPDQFFRSSPWRFKVIGIIRRWVVIFLFVIPWVFGGLNFAENQGGIDFELPNFMTYLRFSRDVFVYKIIEVNISCKDCPPVAYIDEGGKEEHRINLKKKEINSGKLKDRFYRYQILVTGNAKVEDVPELEAGLPKKAYVLQKVKRNVDLNTVILFEPDLVGRPFDWLFAQTVIIWMAIFTFAFWTAFQVAALYVQFVFEFDDLPAIKRFLLQFAFGSRYPLLRIKEGAVIPDDEEKFIAQVGGPGRVQINHDSVTVFEGRDGSSKVEARTPATRGLLARCRNFLILEPFERFRIALPTSVQRMNLSLDHRTRDGIPVNIRNIEARFNIARGKQMGTRENPTPFDPAAVRDLVYNWGHTVALRFSNLVKFQLRVRLLEKTFTELFAVIGAPDREQIRQNETKLQQLAMSQGGSIVNTIDVAGVPESHTRTELTSLFFERARFPVEIQWMNVGTWELPSELLVQRHEEAWKITHENLRFGKKPVLKALRRKAYREGLCDLIREVPLQNFETYQEQGLPAQHIAARLLLDYRNRLLEIEKILDYQEELESPPAVPRKKLQELISILDDLLNNYDSTIRIWPPS